MLPIFMIVHVSALRPINCLGGVTCRVAHQLIYTCNITSITTQHNHHHTVIVHTVNVLVGIGKAPCTTGDNHHECSSSVHTS